MNKQTDKPSFQYKEAPVHFEAVSHQKQVGAYSIGVCHAVGRRSTMEDQHLAEVFDITDASGQRHQAHLFAIFDGHNGAEVAEWVKNHLQSKIAGLLSNKVLDDETIWNVLKMAFVQLNKEIPEAICNQGTTATAALLLNGKIWTANVGDSRTVLENGGEALQLSEDAKPDDPRYKQSITHRDGVVIGHPARIDGVLAVARALGNHGLEGSVSARPKITQISLDQIRPGSQLVLACDGIYDVASTKQVVKSVYDNKSIPAGVLAKNIVYSAFAARSGDNLSVLVVRL